MNLQGKAAAASGQRGYLAVKPEYRPLQEFLTVERPNHSVRTQWQ